MWRCAAGSRILGKGASLEVTDAPIKFYDLRTDELDNLVKNYDKRLDQISPNKSATGTVFESQDDEMKDRNFFIIHSYNLDEVSFSNYFTDQESFFQFICGDKKKLPESYVSNFLWGKFNIEGFYQAHKPFSKAFEEQKGISLLSLIVFIRTLVFRRLMIWRKHGIGAFLHDYQRAYEGPSTREIMIRDLEYCMETYIGMLELNKSELSTNINDVIEYLELNAEKKEAIDILLAGPHSIFLPVFDDKYFVDYAWIHMILYHLFFGVELEDQNFKGDALEKLVHKGKSTLPTNQLRASNGESRQIDAAFEVNNNLVIVECRVKSWSFGFERGDPKAIKMRKDLVVKCLKDIDDKAQFLSTNPSGRNYDISRFKRIIPLGVTPFIEHIPSLNKYFWLRKDLPRVMTPDELNDFLDSDILANSTDDLYNILILQ